MSRMFTIIAFLTLLTASLHGANGNMGRGTDPLANGSQEHPWRIEDLADFQQFCNNTLYWSGFTRLDCDLDLSATVYDRAPIAPHLASGWDFSGTQYSGHFNGNHHTIRHLQIASTGAFVGLVGNLGQTATLADLHLADATITGLSYVGSLCGWSEGQVVNCSVTGNLMGCEYIMQNSQVGGLCGTNRTNGTINNCHSAVHITSRNNVGGLCGVNYGLLDRSFASGVVTGVAQSGGGLCGVNLGTIQRCSSTARVNDIDSMGGGLCGDNYGLIDRSFATGVVTGVADSGGGLCGFNYDTIQRCFSTADVIDVDFIGGGLCGDNVGVIADCYAAGTVAGDSLVGGLCGWSSYATGTIGAIHNCYSTAAVSGSSTVGGFCGRNNSSTAANYWNTETSETENGIGTMITDTLEVWGKTTAQMQMLSTFTDAGWDFSEADGDEAIWMLLREGEDYPRLAWQEVIAGDVAGLYGVNLADVAYLSGYWQTADCGIHDCGRADIDGSGDVDFIDLLAVADNWLKGL